MPGPRTCRCRCQRNKRTVKLATVSFFCWTNLAYPMRRRKKPPRFRTKRRVSNLSLKHDIAKIIVGGGGPVGVGRDVGKSLHKSRKQAMAKVSRSSYAGEVFLQEGSR